MGRHGDDPWQALERPTDLVTVWKPAEKSVGWKHPAKMRYGSRFLQVTDTGSVVQGKPKGQHARFGGGGR